MPIEISEKPNENTHPKATKLQLISLLLYLSKSRIKGISCSSTFSSNPNAFFLLLVSEIISAIRDTTKSTPKSHRKLRL